MWLFYVDEFGDDVSLKDPSAAQPKLKPGAAEWFVLSAVGIPAHSRLTLADQIRITKDRAFPGWSTRPWARSEIKGRHLRYAHDRLSAGKTVSRPAAHAGLTPKTLKRLCADLSWSFYKYRPLVYVVAIDKQRLITDNKGFSPVGIAYTFLQQRLALLTEQILGPSEGVVIVADEHIGHERHFREGEFHKVRAALTRNLRTQPDFELLLDKPVWIDAQQSIVDRELLQLPDIVAYAAGSTCKRDAVPTHPGVLWPAIASHLALNWSSHKVPGGGFTIYPRPSKYPKGL